MLRVSEVVEPQESSSSPSDSDEEESESLNDEKIGRTLQHLRSELELVKKSQSPWDERNLHILQQLNVINSMKNMTIVRSVGYLLIEKQFLNVCVKIWNNCHEVENYLESEVYKMMKSILWNYSDQFPKLAKAAFEQKEMIKCCMKEFTLPELDVTKMEDEKRFYLIEATLSFLYNIVRLHEQNRDLIKKDGGLRNIMKYCKSNDVKLKIYVMILIAHCISKEEENKLATDADVIHYFVVHILQKALNTPEGNRSYKGFSAAEVLIGLDKLALNDDNKKSIVEAGILPSLERVLRDNNFSKEERIVTAHLLWTLSFHPDNKQKLLENASILRTVKALHDCPDHSNVDSDIVQSCNGILFNINNNLSPKTDVPSSATEISKKPPVTNSHIMISYQWNVQDTMIKVRDALLNDGYKVWMDIDKMKSDSLLTGMANAVENAAVVIMAMTEAYQNSNNCRHVMQYFKRSSSSEQFDTNFTEIGQQGSEEAEYAYVLKKPIVPLILHANFQPYSWLGFIKGMTLHIDFSNENDGLDKPLRKMLESVQTILGDLPANNEVVSDSCRNWTTHQVTNWLHTIGISNKPIQSFSSTDGNALHQIKSMNQRSADSYYKRMEEDFHLRGNDLLNFTSALEKLK